MQERFNKQFVDEDTGLLNIGKYDHDRVMEFMKNERNIIVEKIQYLKEQRSLQDKYGVGNFEKEKQGYDYALNDVLTLTKSTNETS
jgi:hypothetical protein